MWGYRWSSYLGYLGHIEWLENLEHSEHSEYSEYSEYLRKPQQNTRRRKEEKEGIELLNFSRILTIMKERGLTEKEGFRQYHLEKKYHNHKEMLEYEITRKLTDEQLIQAIHEEMGIRNITLIQQYNTEKRNEILEKLKEIEGTTIKQLVRVTGINKRILERVFEKSKKKSE